jgi:hypothetical protein
MAKRMAARFPGTCTVCGESIKQGSRILWQKGEGAWHERCDSRNENLKDPEYARGYYETQQAQSMGPPGSAAREAAYMAMEAQWAREGFDG